MINFTPIVRPLFARKVRAVNGFIYVNELRRVQNEILPALLHYAKSTVIGEKYDFNNIKSYSDYRKKIPVSEYPDIRPMVDRMVSGERDILWPGRCIRFAQSSGTSDGKSKYIPITEHSLKLNHYAGASYSVAFYLNQVPDSKLFGGKCMILGGSFANEVRDLPGDVRVGDLSATLIDRINPLVNIFRVPPKNIALMADWTEKLPKLVEASLRQDITNISGVPSWFLTVLRKAIETAGAKTIHDIWPNLEVFFHGGISFEPYRAQYNAITDPAKMHYLENYNASEGFFAVQDCFEIKAMRLLPNIGVFYEFVPLDQVGEPFPESLGAWEVEPGKTYALIITSCNGLWRYALGDTVRIESIEPLRLSIAGRTKCFINAFGEELMVHNAEAAMTAACHSTGAHVKDYTAGPVYTSSGERGHHRWVIEWDVPPGSIETFAKELDRNLQKVNSDYQAKRTGDIFLAAPDIVTVPTGTFDRWLGSTGKLGGQRKVPRLSNTPDIINSIIENYQP